MAIQDAVRRALAGVGRGLYGVACSGGADSMALAHATIAVAGAPHVVVISLDHGLSQRSAEVCAGVATWANGQGAAAVVRAITVPRRASLEAAAREARYAAFAAIADELGLIAVLTGHTARDQAETVLMRIVRGTGPAGLAGIPARRGRYVRPLLALPRDAIEGYVRAHALPTWDDPMNADLQLTRIRIRERVLPVLRHENPRLESALTRLASSAAEWLEVIDGLAAPFARFPIACAALAERPAAVRKRALSVALEALEIDHEATHLERLDRLVTSAPRGEIAIDLPGARLVRSYDLLVVAGAPVAAPSRSPSGLGPGELHAPAGPYVLRGWRAGDRMRPVRLKGRSRKLSDLYIDAKVPRADRLHARVLVRTTDDEIVWAEHIGLAFGSEENLTPSPPE